MKKILSSGIDVAALLVMPATAIAVDASSNDGSGEQHVVSWTLTGANLTGVLKSTAGKPVYFQGAATGSGGNSGYARYTGDVTSTSNVNVGGWAGGLVTRPDGVAVKVCRNYTGWPDSCGTARKISRP